MDYVTVVIITGLAVGFITWISARSFTESKCNRKWTLGIGQDSSGWHPILERHLDARHWEYISINEENKPIIMHIAYSRVPHVAGPFASERESRFQEMLQNMVNLGHGHITGLEKEEVR